MRYAGTRTASGASESPVGWVKQRNGVLQTVRRPGPREGAGRIRMDQHSCHHHPWIVRRVATTVPTVRRVERAQVHCVHQVTHMVRQVTLRNPLPRDPAAEAASGPAGTTETSCPLTPRIRQPPILPLAFATPQNNDRRFLRRRLLAASSEDTWEFTINNQVQRPLAGELQLSHICYVSRNVPQGRERARSSLDLAPSTTGVVGHICWGIDTYDTHAVREELESRGLKPRRDQGGRYESRKSRAPPPNG